MTANSSTTTRLRYQLRFYGLILLMIMHHISSFPASHRPILSVSLSRSKFTFPLSGWLWPWRHSCTFKSNMNMHFISDPHKQFKSADLANKRFLFKSDDKRKWKKHNTVRLYGSRSVNLRMGNSSSWISSISPRTTSPDARVIFASQMEAQRNRKRSTTNQFTSSSSKVRLKYNLLFCLEKSGLSVCNGDY